MKTALADAIATVKQIAVSPVANLPLAHAQLDSTRVVGVAVTFAVIFALCVTFGTNMVLPDWAFSPSFGNSFKLFMASIVPFVSVGAMHALVRKIFGSSGEYGDDAFVAGAALLPVGIATFLSGFLGIGNFEITLILGVFAACYTILILYSGCVHIAKLPERIAVPAVPAIIVLSTWLSKVIFMAVID